MSFFSENLTTDSMPKRLSEAAAYKAKTAEKIEKPKTRKHPDGSTLSKQRDAATKVFRENADLLEEESNQPITEQDLAVDKVEADEVPVLSEEDVKAKLRETGVVLKPQDLKFVRDNIDLFVKHPELGKYLKKLSEKMERLIRKCNKLKDENNERQAIYDTIEFLDKEIDVIEKTIKDQNLKNALITRINQVIDLGKVEKSAKKQISLDSVSEGMNLVPGFGEAKEISEAVVGRTMSGEKLTLIGRTGKLLWNTGSLALGVVTGGLSEVVTKPASKIRSAISMAKTLKLITKITLKSKKALTQFKKVRKVGKSRERAEIDDSELPTEKLAA